MKARARRALWGGPPPAADDRGRFLLAYGLISWLFPVGMLVLLFASLGEYLAATAGPVGLIVAVAAAGLLLSGHARASRGEFKDMLKARRWRTAIWVVTLAGLVAALFVWRWDDRASGPVRLWPGTRAEVRAEVAGFLRAVEAGEGEEVAAGKPVARLEVPQLDTKLTQKRAEHREAQARLKLLEVGPRPEAVTAQRDRVAREREWRDRAKTDLGHARETLKADLERLDKLLSEAKAELDFAAASRARFDQLLARGAAGQEQHEAAVKREKVGAAQFDQAAARRRARVETGTLDAEAELARRGKGLADAEAVLGIMEVGSRPEELDAERARADRLREEVAHLERMQQKQTVVTPVAGVVSTPRLREAVGRYFREGELICVVEDPGVLEAEIAIDEREVTRVQPGQPVEMKVQVIPRETFTGKVDRVAPRAAEEKDRGQTPGKVTVYCRLDRVSAELRPGMTGHGRVTCGRRTVGGILVDRVLRAVRPEYWWL